MIDVTDDGNVLVVAPAGELDLTTSPQLVEAFASKAEHTVLVCDVARDSIASRRFCSISVAASRTAWRHVPGPTASRNGG